MHRAALSAVGAHAEHGKVVGVDGEAELGVGGLGQTTEETFRGLDQFAARFTHEVSVGRSGQVIRRGPMTQVGVDDDPKTLQLVEISIDRRDVNVRCLRLHRCGKFFGGVVPRSVEEESQEKAPRRGDPTPVLAEEGQRAFERAGVPGTALGWILGVRHASSVTDDSDETADGSRLPAMQEVRVVG